MRTLACIALVVFLNYFQAPPVGAQSARLQAGVPIERDLAAGQTHSFSVSLEKDQFLQLVVDQHGIDVVVRAFSPEGRRLGEFDSPNGAEGPENVSFIAETAGLYRIEVAPLGQDQNSAPGRYEIRIVELRKATEQELQGAKNQEVLKQKALAMLMQITVSFQELGSAPTRARFQIKAGQLLWSSDEKFARKLLEQAIDSVKEFIAGIDPDENYFENFQAAMQLRSELVNALGGSAPELALDFLRATRTLRIPDEYQENSFTNQDLEMEVSLVRQIAANDPKRAFEIAEDTLKSGYAGSLPYTLSLLGAKEPELAARLAHDIITKVLNEKLLQHQDAAFLAINLLRVRPRSIQSSGSDDSAKITLIPEDDYRELLQKLMTEALSYSPPSPNYYSPERNVAQNILSFLKEMASDVQALAPDSSAAIDKKFAELNNQNDPQSVAWQQYQNTINSSTIDNALQATAQAPREIRNQLYQQIANKAAEAGDFTRARQIINDQITNPGERRQARRNLDQQAIFSAASKGRVEEALRNLRNIHPASERTRILIQIVDQIGSGQKKAAALQSLEQARSLVGDSPVAENQEQAAALLEIARVFSKYDANRGFELLEPLIEQFNAISAAAITMNGFGQRFYDKSELIMTNGNAVAEISNRLAMTIAALALVDFERARQTTDRIRPLGPRINAYLTIAEQAIQSAQRNALPPRITIMPD